MTTTTLSTALERLAKAQRRELAHKGEGRAYERLVDAKNRALSAAVLTPAASLADMRAKIDAWRAEHDQWLEDEAAELLDALCADLERLTGVRPRDAT